MDKKLSPNNKTHNTFRQTIERTLRLQIKIERPSTTARGRLAQVFRLLARKALLRRSQSLLHIAAGNSPTLANLLDTTKRHIASLPTPTTTKTKHLLSSDNEEQFFLAICHQKQLSILLALRLRLSDGVLTIHIEAPLFLWLKAALKENHSNLLLYDTLLSSFSCKGTVFHT